MSHTADWIPLIFPYTPRMQEIYLQQYHAAQFLALSGKHLIPPEADDSHTNFRFNPHLRMFVGNKLTRNKRLGLHLDHLTLHILDEHKQSLTEFKLEGKTRVEAYNELIYLLVNDNINVSNLKHELHYETIDHPLMHGSVFELGDPKLTKEVIAHRHNAERVLEKVIPNSGQATPIRIWPHHFDTGTVIPLTYTSGGNYKSSLGLGWAIPDNLVDEPYFYLSFWSAEIQLLPSHLPELDSGQWKTPGWNGAILSLSEILEFPSPEKQEQAVVAFFRSGMKSIKQSFNNRG